MNTDLDIHDRLLSYCLHFEDFEALRMLKVNFLKNKQTLEQITCQLSDIVHDNSKTWGEDGYYLGQKVEVKNTCYLGKTKLNGRVKFHDLNLNRVQEFRNEPYWLVIGCYNYTHESTTSCEIIFGFKIDEVVAAELENRLLKGQNDPEIGLPVYKHIFEKGVAEDGIKIFYYDGPLTPSVYTKSMYQYLQTTVAQLEPLCI